VNYPIVSIAAVEEGYIVRGEHLTPEPTRQNVFERVLGFRIGPDGNPTPIDLGDEEKLGKHTQTFAVPTLERALEVAGKLLSGASVPAAFREV
jgi:hypothetical protein